jgi:hypothetical protein
MDNSKYNVSICSPPDRERLVAAISFGGIQWAEIDQETIELRVEFYPRPDGKVWNISLANAEEALQFAKRRLQALRDPSTSLFYKNSRQ